MTRTTRKTTPDSFALLLELAVIAARAGIARPMLRVEQSAKGNDGTLQRSPEGEESLSSR